MIELGRSEIENAKSALPYVEEDSRLGYELSMEYMTDPKRIMWKIDQVRDVIEKEIPAYIQKRCGSLLG
jgi:hypothetical protein